jgi:site-specific DNA recombinase
MDGRLAVLGYDVDPSRTRLVVNEAEAERVREIFGLFLRGRSVTATLEEIRQRGWRMKSWTTRAGEQHVGEMFDRHGLVRLLSNRLYIGQVQHQGKVYQGEQPAIVERAVWKKANRLLKSRLSGNGSRERNRQGALLQGLLHCAGCGKRMVAGYTTKGGRRYSYYVCQTAQKRGAGACRGKLVAAGRIERAVVGVLYGIAGQPGGERLGKTLPIDPGSWEELERKEQCQMVAAAVEQIRYDRRLQQGWMRLRESAASRKVILCSVTPAEVY